VRRTISILRKGGGYIIAPSQGITSEMKAENIEALRQAAREFAANM